MSDFGKELRRNTDPATSDDAARSMVTVTARHKALVLYVLREHPYGLTPAEVASRCTLDHSQVWRRMSDLYNEGLIEECGKRKQPSGRNARVMRIVPVQLRLV